MKSIKANAPLLAALLLAAVMKMGLIITHSVPFNGDEAVVATMARHILGGARPYFFYGQAYMGSLDAWLLAGAFRLFGERVFTIRIVQAFLYIIYMITVWWLARIWFKDTLAPTIVVLLAAIPPVLVTTYTSATLGGYNETLILGNLVLGLGYLVTIGGEGKKWWLWLILGLVGGLGFWTMGLAGLYLLTIGMVGLRQFRWGNWQRYLLAACGFILGSLPWWWYNLQHNWLALFELTGHRVYQTTLIERVASFMLMGIPALMGMRFPWRVSYLPWYLAGLALVLYLGIAVFLMRGLCRGANLVQKGALNLMAIFVVITVLATLISRYGIDPSGRYQLPLYLPLLLASTAFVKFCWERSKIWGVIILLLVWGINLGGTVLAATSPDKLTTQFDPISSFDNSHDQYLIDFLQQKGEYRGYTNYWTSFRLAFLSQEQLIYSAELPYKADMSYNPVDIRYRPYAQMADASDRTAYITSKHPVLDDRLRTEFKRLGVSWKEIQLGEFHVFYQLSRAVRPEEIGFGGEPDLAP